MLRPFLGLALASCALQAGAQGAGLSVSPVVLEIAAARQVATVTVRNGTPRPMTFQGEGLAWMQVDGVDRFERSDDLVVVPAIAEIPPSGSQVFRVGLRKPQPADVERTYRVVLEELAPANASGANEVTFRYVHNLPVLIAPAAKVSNVLRWSACAAAPARAASGACIVLRNGGNRRIKLQEIELAGEGWQRKLDLSPGFNLLAGASREWRFQVPAGRSPEAKNLRVHAPEADGLRIETE